MCTSFIFSALLPHLFLPVTLLWGCIIFILHNNKFSKTHNGRGVEGAHGRETKL